MVNRHLAAKDFRFLKDLLMMKKCRVLDTELYELSRGIVLPRRDTKLSGVQKIGMVSVCSSLFGDSEKGESGFLGTNYPESCLVLGKYGLLQ